MKTVVANDPRAPSVQIADDLRARIDSGEFASGERLPSIRDLATEYGVAPMTAQGALQRLREDHRVYANGRGHFVGTGAEETPPDLATQLREIQAEVRELRSRVESLESSQ